MLNMPDWVERESPDEEDIPWDLDNDYTEENEAEDDNTDSSDS